MADDATFTPIVIVVFALIKFMLKLIVQCFSTARYSTVVIDKLGCIGYSSQLYQQPSSDGPSKWPESRRTDSEWNTILCNDENKQMPVTVNKYGLFQSIRFLWRLLSNLVGRQYRFMFRVACRWSYRTGHYIHTYIFVYYKLSNATIHESRNSATYC